jgi:nucleoside 2-deoxyribosyltransferase
MKLLYLAGPIGKQTIEESGVWRKQVEESFEDLYSINIRSPLRGKKEENRKSYTDAEIVLRDKLDIKDLVLVFWPERTVSNGTAMEILYAYENKVPVIFVGSWAREDVWVRHHVVRIFDELDEAVDYIKEMWL